ncbi:MAG: DUF2752 domain-containing protein [Bacteroidia bacterium]|nr:DUF2752 domain-containing protein [Bacteroidia bacterium]MCX7651917.1 DUF2752 domain-containing protein [Bacteroidia bacterium]MDW8416068.1 DUF2752 domain-containing protein [Bacteroidia bacterium]
MMNRHLEYSLRIILLVLPGVLILLPADFFDKGPTLCVFKNLTDVDCPGCGLTRATQHFLHLEWERALEYNPLVLLAVPILGWIWVKNLLWLYSYWKSRTGASKASV